jgi:hypothetical protein
VTLRPVLTNENLDEVVARAAFKTDEETKHLVATLMPRPAPREGIRKLPEPAPRLPVPAPEPARAAARDEAVATAPMDMAPRAAAGETPAEGQRGELLGFALTSPVRTARPSLEPLSEDHWSMRVTIDAALKEDLETLKGLLSQSYRRASSPRCCARRCAAPSSGTGSGVAP